MADSIEAMLEAPLKGEKFLNELDFDEKSEQSRRSDRRESNSARDRSPDSRSSRRKRSRSPRDRDSQSRRSRSPRGDERDRRLHRRSRSPRDDRDRRHGREDRRDRDRDRDRGRDGDSRRSRDDRRSRSPPRKRRESPDYKKRERSPPMSVEEHEMRSVFVSQLSARVGERELIQFLEANVGPVRDARIIVDRISRRSKGVGYAEFKDLDSVAKAIALTGTKLLGIPMQIQLTEAERNRLASQGNSADSHPNIPIPPGSDAHPNLPIPYNRLYIGSLNFNLTDADIRQVFEPFGPVDVCDLHRDTATGKSKGYAFVQFRLQKDAAVALEKMNNFPLAGRPIKVGLVSEMPKTAAIQRPNEHGGAPSTMGPRPSGLLNPNLDDPDRGGNLSGISRIELMHKLSREEKAVDINSLPMWKPNIPTAASKCVLLKNMFDPAEETERDWDRELREDVRAEVQEKYGDVADIFLLKDSKGEIYVKFVSQEASTKAIEGLNGRFFGGKRVSASFISDAMYSASKP